MPHKEEILKDIRSLIAEIDKCTEDLLMAWTLKDGHKISVATSEMSKVMVAAHQELSFLYDYITAGGKDA